MKGVHVKVGDWLRIVDPHLWDPDRPLEGQVIGVDRHNGFELAINGDMAARTYYRAERKGTIEVRVIDPPQRHADQP